MSGSGRGGQQDDGRRGKHQNFPEKGLKDSHIWAQFVLLCIDKYGVIH